MNAGTAAITHLRDVDIPTPAGNNVDWWHSAGKPGTSQYHRQWFKGQVPVLTVPPRSPAIWPAQIISAGYQGTPPILCLLQYRSAEVAEASPSLHSSGSCNPAASSSTAGCIQSHNTAFSPQHLTFLTFCISVPSYTPFVLAHYMKPQVTRQISLIWEKRHCILTVPSLAVPICAALPAAPVLTSHSLTLCLGHSAQDLAAQFHLFPHRLFPH